VTNILISVFRIRMYFLRIRIRRSVILNYGSGPGTREANSLEIRPDPEPIRTLLWPFKNMWSNRYVLAPVPYIIINLIIFFPKICLNVLQNSKDPDPKHYLMYKRKIATCEISKWRCNPGYICWTYNWSRSCWLLTLCEFLLCMDVVSNVAQLFLHHSAKLLIGLKKVMTKVYYTVYSTSNVRIRDIFVRIRIHTTNLWIWIRVLLGILLFSSVTFKMPTKNIFSLSFLAYYFLKVHLHHSWKIKSLEEISRNQEFSYYFCLLIEGSGSVSLTTDPDPGSPRNTTYKYDTGFLRKNRPGQDEKG
jgi:hypothetical protein